MKVAVLTSPNQWMVPYAQTLAEEICDGRVFYNHEEVSDSIECLFILSYHKIIPSKLLEERKHNIVIHESDLPSGRGWAPLFWQVIEGRAEVVFSMFEAGEGLDDGDVYLRETLHLEGTELHNELRERQAGLSIKMCRKFLENYDEMCTPTHQEGEESYYEKRTPQHSELNPRKSISEQFDLLRVVSNQDYPAFFYMRGKKYILTISHCDQS